MFLTGNFRKMVMFKIKPIMNTAGNKYWVEFTDKFEDNMGQKFRKIQGFLTTPQCKVVESDRDRTKLKFRPSGKQCERQRNQQPLSIGCVSSDVFQPVLTMNGLFLTIDVCNFQFF